MSSEIIYKTKNADAIAIFEHLNASKGNFIPPLNQKVNLMEYAKKILDNAITFEAWQNDELIGIIAAYLNDTENKIGYITNVSLLSQYKGKGIASQLLENCINYALELKFSQINLEVNDLNNDAIKLYTKYNFIKSNKIGNSHYMIKKLNNKQL